MPDVTRTGGEIAVSFDADEATLLRNLLEEMRLLLEADIPRGDAVIGRLFPQAYEDPDEEASYREMVGGQLHDAKRNGLRIARDALGEKGAATVRVGPEETDAWLALLTDLRLAIGTRLDVDEEKMSAAIDPADPEAPAYAVLHWLGWVQASILEEVRP